MNIIGGQKRGTKLTPLSGTTTRPTAMRTREALFNILEGGRFGQPLYKSHLIDICAGTGALGLEALSRGAETACFIEQDKNALSVLKQNIDRLGYEKESHIISADISKSIHYHLKPAQLVFCDAPYDSGLAYRALQTLSCQNAFDDNALIIIETRKNEMPEVPDLFEKLEDRRYGMARLSLFSYRP